MRNRLWLPVLALSASCRCGWFAPGLGSGIDGVEKPGPRTQAQALASLALVEGESGHGLGSMPVLAVREGRVYLLAFEDVHPDRVTSLRATFTSEEGKSETVGDAVVAAREPDSMRGSAVLSFPGPSFPVRPVVIASASTPPAANAIRVVSLRRREAPAIEPATAKNEVSSDARQFTVRAKSSWYRTVLIFDEKTWHLVGLGRGSDEINAVGAVAILQTFTGKVRRAEVALARTDDDCQVTATVELDDPLGTFLEGGLVVGEPGAEWAIPEVRKPGENGALEPGSQIVPVGKRFAVRGSPDEKGRFVLTAEAKRCDEPRFVQVVLIGERERRLSLPYRLGGEGAAAVVLAADESAWRAEEAAAAEPVVFSGEPIHPAPPAEAEGRCRQPLARLDPDGVYFVGRRPSFDENCSDGMIVFPVGAEEQARCMQAESLLGIAADGFPVYRVTGKHDWETVAWRRAVPDRNAPDADGRCRLASPRSGDDLLAASPCPRRLGASKAGVFLGPDGEIIFGCPDGYRRRDGTRLELHGATLVRPGEKGMALVRLPWGMLGVLGADGKGREVGGLPVGAQLSRLRSAAVKDGFLVAVQDVGSDGGPELFHVSFDGKAVSRGRFDRLVRDADSSAHVRRLGGDGTLYTWSEFSDGVHGAVTRWEAGGGSEVVYDPKLRPEEDRLRLRPLLFGWRSAGPIEPQQPYRGPNTRETSPQKRALAVYALADPGSLPCKATLEQLDPKTAWVRWSSKVFDPADPDRYTWVPSGARVVISGDGRPLVFVTGDASSRSSGQVEVAPGVEGLRPRTEHGEACERFADAPAGSAVTGGVCGPETQPLDWHSEFTPWAAVPGEAGAAMQCARRSGPGGSVVGSQDIPAGLRLAHAGLGGRLLVTSGQWPRRSVFSPSDSPQTWALALGNGRVVPVNGITGTIRAIRAVTAGFVLATEVSPGQLHLVLVTDDGRVRKSGSYPPLEADVEIQGAAITADLALHALIVKFAQPIRLVRLPVDGRQTEMEWLGPQGNRPDVEVLTGP